MSFDPHSLERLRELGRQLPQELPKPTITSKVNKTDNKKLHSIEREHDPQALFRELMKASPDGSVPSHLIERLKEVEANHLKDEQETSPSPNIKTPQSSTKSKLANSGKGHHLPQSLENRHDENNLYASFKRLLLEDEDDT